MLLKDCPVGSVVRLVSLCGEDCILPYWEGEFVVFEKNGVHMVTDGDGDIRDEVYDDPDYQFEIVTPAPAPNQDKTIYLKGKTYNLTPVRTSDVIEIDGVEYYMEEQK